MPYSPNTMIGGTVVQAAGLIAADTPSAAVQLGHTDFTLLGTWTACEIDTGNELYLIVVEANTKAAPTTWTQIGVLAAMGHTSVLGGAASSAATGSLKAAFHNEYDYQIRVNTWVSGTIATGINMAVTAFPLQNLSYT